MAIELSPEVENAVRARASAEGLSVNDLLARIFAAEAPADDPQERVRRMIAQWQAQDNTPTLPPIPTRNGETLAEALFRKWQEEDSALTDEEIEAEQRFWEEFQQSMNETRAAQGMRRLF